MIFFNLERVVWILDYGFLFVNKIKMFSFNKKFIVRKCIKMYNIYVMRK